LRKYQRLIKELEYREVVRQNAIASAAVWAIVAESAWWLLIGVMPIPSGLIVEVGSTVLIL
jgi:hypothetical protein